MEVDAVSAITVGGFQERAGTGQLQFGKFAHAGTGDHDLISCNHGNLLRTCDEPLSIEQVCREIALHPDAAQFEFVCEAGFISAAKQSRAEKVLYLDCRINDFCIQLVASYGIMSRFGWCGRDGGSSPDDGVPKLQDVEIDEQA